MKNSKQAVATFFTYHQVILEDWIKEEHKEPLMAMVLDFLYEDGEPVEGELQERRFYHNTEQEAYTELIELFRERTETEEEVSFLVNIVAEIQLCKWQEQGDKVIPLNGFALSELSSTRNWKSRVDKENPTKASVMTDKLKQLEQSKLIQELKELLPEGVTEAILNYKEPEEQVETKSVEVPEDITEPLMIDNKQVLIGNFVRVLQREGYDKEDMLNHICSFSGMWLLELPVSTWKKVFEEE